MWAEIAKLFAPIGLAALTGLLMFAATWIRSGQDRAAGAAQAQLSTAKAVATTAAAVAQAEATAPRNKDALVASLKSGSF